MKNEKPAKEFIILITPQKENDISSAKGMEGQAPLMAILTKEGYAYKDTMLNQAGEVSLEEYREVLLLSLTSYTNSEDESMDRTGLSRCDSVVGNYNHGREGPVFKVKSRSHMVLDKKMIDYLPSSHAEYGYLVFRQYRGKTANSGDLKEYKRYSIKYDTQPIPAHKRNRTVGYICFFPARSNAPALLNIFTVSSDDSEVFGMLLWKRVWHQLNIDLTSTSLAHVAMVEFSTKYEPSLLLSEVANVPYEVIMNIQLPDKQ